MTDDITPVFAESVAFNCENCGYYGWVHPPAYERPETLESDCPDCGITFELAFDVTITSDP